MKRKKWRLLSPQRGSVPWHRHVIGMGLLSLWFLSACNLEVPPKAVQSTPVVKASVAPTPTSAVSQNPSSFPSQAASFPTALPSGIIIPSFQPTATPIPTVPPDPSAAYRHLETFDGRAFCLPLETTQMTPRLRYPIDVAVSKDGNTVYVMNKRCDVPIMTKFVSSVEDDCNQTATRDNPIVKRAYIHTISKSAGINVLKINNQSPLSCQMGEDIEIDAQGNLYLNAPGDNRLYRIPAGRNTIELLGEYKAEGISSEYGRNGAHSTFWMPGPYNIQVQGSHIYFVLRHLMNSNAGQLREWTSTNQSTIWIEKEWIFPYYLVQEQKDLFFADVNGIGKVPFRSYQGAPFSNCLNSNSCMFTGGMFIYNGEHRFGGISGFIDGPPEQALFSRIIALRSDSAGYLYAVDLPNHAIRKVTPDGYVTTLAGNGQPGFKDGKGREAQFNYPTAIDLDDAGNVYVADTGNHAIRKITPDGLVTTFYAETNPN